uniref:Uncharacterized protein n=1 Tax=Anguilla anguilla TaxID=7936 RepID=A0A0E9U211_ANGAN
MFELHSDMSFFILQSIDTNAVLPSKNKTIYFSPPPPKFSVSEV